MKVSDPKRPWPRCAALDCELEADVNFFGEGDSATLEGNFCNAHLTAIQALFAFQITNIALLRIISSEVLHENLNRTDG